MLKRKSDYSAASILRSARKLRRQLGDDRGKVKLTITGGGGRGYPDGGRPTAIAAETINADTRDEANAFFNKWAAAGCDCTQPRQTTTGDWFVECTCSSEEE